MTPPDPAPPADAPRQETGAVRLHPFTGSIVAAHRAQRVVAPPYDALAPEQRAAIAATDPDSFLGALPSSGAEADAAVGAELDRRLQVCRATLDRLRASGAFEPLPDPSLVILTIDDHEHRVTAIVGDIEVAAFHDGRVLPHELTRPARVAELARYFEVVGVASSPVAVAHRPSATVDRLVAQVVRGQLPEVAFAADDGADVSLHVAADPDMVRALGDAVTNAGTLYVVDGHHRAAAVQTYAAGEAARPQDPARTTPRSARVLTAVLSTADLAVRPFHRRLDGLELPAGQLPTWLEQRGMSPVPTTAPATAPDPGSAIVTDGSGWWRIDLDRHRRAGPVDGLDVSTVERELLDPLAGPRTRTVAIAPSFGLDALVRPGSLGVALAAPPLDAMLDVADAGATMPAKTTYVVPKLRSGLLLAPR